MKIARSGILLVCLTLSGGCRTQVPEEASEAAEHHLIADLGPEHIANAVIRQGADGENFLVAWGDRVLQFPFESSAPLTEVIPASEDWEYTNGGCALDVNQDGVEDIVVGRGRGPQKAQPDMLWIEFARDGSAVAAHRWASLEIGNWKAPHDIQPFELNEPEAEGVVFNVGREEIFFARKPENPVDEWPIHKIGTFPLPNQSGLEIADLDSNGVPDLISGMFWIEPAANPLQEEWRFHRFNSWEPNRWTGMAQIEVEDLDGDGRLEIALTEAEIPGGRLAVFRQKKNPRDLWEPFVVADDLYCPHSLEIADLDENGAPDLIVGEMSAGGWEFPLQENPRVLAFLQQEERLYEKFLLSEGWGVHEMKLAPFRLEGDPVLFAADEIQLFKFPQMGTHISYWRIRQEALP